MISNERLLELIKENDEIIKAFISKRVFDPNTRKDVYQELMYKLFNTASSYDPSKNTKFTTWVYRIITNIQTDSFLNRKSVITTSLTDNEHLLNRLNYKNHNNLQYNDLKKYILKSLPIKYHLIYRYYYQEDKTNKEISELLNIPESSVKVYVARIGNFLQNKINSHYFN